MVSGECALLDTSVCCIPSDQFQRFWSIIGWPILLGEVVSMKEHVAGQSRSHEGVKETKEGKRAKKHLRAYSP